MPDNTPTYTMDFTTGEFVCNNCGRHFPTHYRVTKGDARRQLGRRWVAGNNNFFRHLYSCKGVKV